MSTKTIVNPAKLEAITQELLKSEPLCPNCGDKGCPYCEQGNQHILREDLVSVLVGGANSRNFVGLISETEPPIKSPKTSGMGGRIKKLSHMTIYMGGAVSYGNIVKNRQAKLAKELEVGAPDWEPAPRQWGERVPHTPFVLHKEKLYLECMVVSCHRVEYRLDGQPVEHEKVVGYLREKSATSRQNLTVESAEGKDDSREVVWRTFGLDSIVQVTLNGKVYEVVDKK